MTVISTKTKNQILSIVPRLVILSCTLLAFSIQAQRADVRILDSAFIASEPGGESFVEIQFTCGVRYKGHSPKSKGKELRIRIAPITCAANRDEEIRRESIRPKTDNAASLLEVLYEGDIPGGPYLTLYFSRQVNFRVAQGNDFRSLSVFVFDQAPNAE